MLTKIDNPCDNSSSKTTLLVLIFFVLPDSGVRNTFYEGTTTLRPTEPNVKLNVRRQHFSSRGVRYSGRTVRSWRADTPLQVDPII